MMNMVRKTITIHDQIYDSIQKIRAKLIEARVVDDLSFTSAINMVLLAGVMATKYFDDNAWKAIADFLNKEKEKLDHEALFDQLYEKMLVPKEKEEEEKTESKENTSYIR